jgi:hypothetical protein
MIDTHQWSGWPGAHCQACGIEDQRELCIADQCPDAWRPCPGVARTDPHSACSNCFGTGVVPYDCPQHRNPPCLAALADGIAERT